jgi:3-oxoacyl-[acyl-carrier protein] reductase
VKGPCPFNLFCYYYFDILLLEEHEMELTGKIALVTGGTKGIGGATAVNLARCGADVAIAARHEGVASDEVLREIEKTGRKGVFYQADLAQPKNGATLVGQVISDFGGIDILFHNAGGPAPGGIKDVSDDAWYQAFDLHVHAAFHLVRAAIPSMEERGGGSIMLMSSIAGLRGVPGIVTYSTVKSTMIQFARSLAIDLAESNIRVNAICPGIVPTDFHKSMSDEQKEHNLKNRLPLHNFGAAEDVAEAVVMMIANEFITGEKLVVDGGMTMRIVV